MIINGLFGVNNGTIRDLVINSGKINAGGYVGSIVGENHGSIINCGNRINVEGKDWKVGGICGYCYRGSISGCFNSGNVNGNGYKYSESDTGGICGGNTDGVSIEDCYNSGEISGISYVGGITGGILINGKSETCFKRCFNSGTVVR